MLKIVYICSTLQRTGPVNILYNILSVNRVKEEITPYIITLSLEGEDSRLEDFEVLGIQVISLNLSHSSMTLLGSKVLLKELNKLKPDICHSFGFRADILCCRKCIRNNFTVTSSLYNYPYDDYPMLYGVYKGRMMAKLHIKALKRFDKVITCSEFIKSKLAILGVDNIVRIYTGVDSHFFRPVTQDRKMEVRKRLDIPKDAIVFIFIGYLIKRKNPLILVDAFAKLLNDNPELNVYLLVMGDGPLMEDCKNIYNGDKISYIGHQLSTREWLEARDVYISSSFSEGFPTAVLEAMASGLICLLSDISPHVEMVKGIDTQYLFSPINTDYAAQLMYSIVRSEDMEEQKIRVRQYFENNFSADIMWQKHIDFYKQLFFKIDSKG